MKGNTLKKKCKNIVCCPTRLQGAILGNLPSGTLKRLIRLTNLAACVRHWNTEYFRAPVMPERWKCRLPKQHPMEWVTNQIFLTGRCLQGLHNSEVLFFFLGKQLFLPFVFAKCGDVPWTMTARQPFHTLRDCSVLGMVLIQNLLKSHTCSKESGGKVEGN